MSIPRYGLLTAQVVEGRRATDSFAHYQVIAQNPDNGERYQIDVNVRSQDGSEVLYYLATSFQNELTARLLSGAQNGIQPLPSAPDTLALDYLRGGLFPTQDLQPLGMESPPRADLNDLIDQYVQQALQTPGARLFAFGQSFDDDARDGGRRRSSQGPSKGIHDIHMNQGNFGRWTGDNGAYQDGGLLFYFPTQGWVALFLAFQQQSFQTDARGQPTGLSWAQLHGGEVIEGANPVAA